MKFYVTFGQSHAHSIAGKTFDKDCVAEIEAENYENARGRAFELFDREFCFIYSRIEDVKVAEFYPRGIIEC